MEKKELQQLITDLIASFGISVRALQPALKVIIPRLPVRLLPFLAFLPLAIEIAQLLHKHREKIRDTIDPLTKQVSNEVRKGTDGIAEIFSHLPKKIGKKIERKLSRWSEYLPFALEIAKASYQKNSGKVQSLTASLPSKVKKRIARKVKKRVGRIL